jgi:hypothetical protein
VLCEVDDGRNEPTHVVHANECCVCTTVVSVEYSFDFIV